MGITKIKAIELVFDWSLWPRQSAQVLDSTNVARMRAALRSGYSLPPVVANKKDLRIVDGFHRTRAVLDVFGEDTEIDVDLHDFATDAEMFLAAGAYNSQHGLVMGPKDRAHFIIRARKYKIPPAAIAEALHMDPEVMKEFVKSRSAKTQSGETIPLPAGARGLAGKTLTDSQEHYARTANGCLPEMYAYMLLNALRAEALELTEKTTAKLRELHTAIGVILDEVA